MTARLFCAIDTVNLALARYMAGQLIGPVDGIKLGLEFFAAHGPEGVRAVLAEARGPSDRPVPFFLDLKLHDIPNTVAGGVRGVLPLAPEILTIHASGGPAMMRAATEAAAGTGTRVVAVTVLTSLGDEDLEAVGQHGPASEQVGRLADLALASGLAGIVCSAHEAAAMRKRLGPDALLVVPGIRPSWSDTNDQKRFVGPAEAVRLGADVLVVGRPITEAGDPVAAAQRIKDEMTKELT